MSAYRKLIAWQKAMDLVDTIYSVVRNFPADERYVLADQIRRAAISIPSNIAEGQGRWTKAEYRQFLRHARGSALELETQILIAHRQGLLDNAMCDALIARTEEVCRLLNGLLRYTLRPTPATCDPRPAT